MKLPSGAELEINLSPFSISKSLYQAVLDELKSLKVDANTELDINFFKDVFCVGLSSKKIEFALDECMKRAIYNGLKIDKDTFEPAAAREDYIAVCFEVAKVNLIPFTKNLFAQYSPALEKLKSSLA